MKHLTIDNGTYVENVTNKLVRGLYDLTNASDYVDGELKGTIIVDNAYQSEIDDLEGRFLDLHIEIGVEPYIGDDPKFKTAFATMGDGIGITETMRPNITTVKGFSGNTQITNLDFLQQFPGLTTIADNAFKNCTNLESVEIPNSVTSVGYQAFYGCNNITHVIVPDSVIQMGDSPFSITLSSNLSSPLYNSTFFIVMPNSYTGSYSISNGIKKICTSAFLNCSNLTSISIPNSVIDIGKNAFCNCTNLTSVTVSDNITSIGDCAFFNCTNLTSITIPDGVTNIGVSAFAGTGLTSVTIPGSVKSIEAGYSENSSNNGSFSNCPNLESIIIEEGVEKIKDGYDNVYSQTAHYCAAFYNDPNLTSITIPSTLSYIGDYAFVNRTSTSKPVNIFISDLTAWFNIEFGTWDSNPFRGGSLYLNNVEVKDLIVPNDVTTIKYCAFLRCGGLTSITIGSNVTNIQNNSFYGCNNLTSITINSTVPPTLTGSSYSGIFGSNCPIYVPQESVETYKSATGWSYYASRIQAIQE